MNELSLGTREAPDTVAGTFLLYRVQLTLALTALVVNGMIALYAYASDSFPPHTIMYRALLTVDVIENIGHALDAVIGAAATETPYLLRRSLTSAEFSFYQIRFLSPNRTAEETALINVSDCGTGRPYLFALLIARQWGAVIVMIMGFERFLFVIYPLWFSSIRVRRGPIIIFTLLFATLSAAVAYTNSLFVAPDELTPATCQLTWAFGEHYGWFFSFFVLTPNALSCAFVAYAKYMTSSRSAFFRFGNNRNKLASERRKIWKTKLIVIPSALLTCITQLGAVLLHVWSPGQLNALKQAVGQILLLKFFTNFYIYRMLGRSRRGIFYAARVWMENRSKRRIVSNDSITSVSINVG